MNWGRFDGLIIETPAGAWEWIGSQIRASDGLRLERWASKCSVCGVKIVAIATLPGGTRQKYYERRAAHFTKERLQVRLHLPERSGRKALELSRCKAHAHLQRQAAEPQLA